MGIQKINIGDKLKCTVCGKEFIVSVDTVYITRGGYTCGWKCFLDSVRETQKKTDKKKD